MKQNIKNFLLNNSEPQNLFIYSKNGYIFNKGKLDGKLVKDIYNEDKDGLIEYLDELYNEGNINTKKIIIDIKKELRK